MDYFSVMYFIYLCVQAYGIYQPIRGLKLNIDSDCCNIISTHEKLD